MQFLTLIITNIPLILLYLSQLFPHSQAKNLALNTLKQNSTNSTFSPWLTGRRDPRFFGCRWRPWICELGADPRVRRRCCRNRCVELNSNVNNCGLCGRRCPFTWQCCSGICRNINVNPYHCGKCDHRCKFPSFCFYGMCGYAQPLPLFPPRPFPPKAFPPPRQPFPAKPFPLPRLPFPPKPSPPSADDDVPS